MQRGQVIVSQVPQPTCYCTFMAVGEPGQVIAIFSELESPKSCLALLGHIFEACFLYQCRHSCHHDSHQSLHHSCHHDRNFEGIFFVIPCTDSYKKVDLRTVSFDVPPQEVARHHHLDDDYNADHDDLDHDNDDEDEKDSTI